MILNQVKTVFLLGVLTMLLLIVGFVIGGKNGLTIALILAIAMNFGSYFYSHKLILFMYKAKPAPESSYPNLHEMVETIAKEAHIPKPKIYIIPTNNPNAFATGPSPKKAILGYTKGILEILDKDELKGVTAHEIAHVKNRDMLISTIAATIAAVISYIGFMARWSAIFGGMGDRGGNNPLGLLAMAIIAPLAATLIQLAISRSREYVADETGARLIKSGKPLASALEKLEAGSKHHPLTLGNQSTNNLFIVNPFRGRGASFARLFLTHPSTKKRVEKLNALKC